MTGLDPEVSAELYSIIHELNEQDHIAVIMVSHDMEGGLRDARHVLYLDGTVQYYAPIEEFRSSGYAQHLHTDAHLREVYDDRKSE